MLNLENMTQVGLTDVIVALRASPLAWLHSALVVPRDKLKTRQEELELAAHMLLLVAARRDMLVPASESGVLDASEGYRALLRETPEWVLTQL